MTDKPRPPLADRERIAAECGDVVRDELERFDAAFVQPERERQERQGYGRRRDDSDWRRWLSEHMPAAIALGTVIVLALGWMGGRLLSNEEREHAEFRAALIALNDWKQRLDIERAGDARTLNQFSALAQEAINGINDLKREQFEAYRAAALARGEYDKAAKLKRKLDAVPPSGTTGSGGQQP